MYDFANLSTLETLAHAEESGAPERPGQGVSSEKKGGGGWKRRSMHNLSKFHKIRDRVCTSALSFKVASLFCCCWRCLSRKAGGLLLVATPGHCAQIFREERLSHPAKTSLLKYQGHKG